MRFNNLKKEFGFAYHVPDPERYAVVEFKNEMDITSIEEKPKSPKVIFCNSWILLF